MTEDKIDPDRSSESNILILSAVAQKLRIGPLLKNTKSPQYSLPQAQLMQ